MSKLTAALKEKEDQCRHIASVLHSKNTEWKRIKQTLATNKMDKSTEGVSVRTGSPPYVNDSENTQLPSQVESSPTHSHTNLDILIDLFSDGEEGDNGEIAGAFNNLIDAKVQKRKGHSRGCSCCDKVRMNTENSISNTNNYPFISN